MQIKLLMYICKLSVRILCIFENISLELTIQKNSIEFYLL